MGLKKFDLKVEIRIVVRFFSRILTSNVFFHCQMDSHNTSHLSLPYSVLLAETVQHAHEPSLMPIHLCLYTLKNPFFKKEIKKRKFKVFGTSINHLSSSPLCRMIWVVHVPLLWDKGHGPNLASQLAPEDWSLF